MMKKLLKVVFVVFAIVSLVAFVYGFNGLVQTSKTSSLSSYETPEVSDTIVTLSGQTTLVSKVLIFNNGTLPLNLLSGPEILVFLGKNRTPISNYTLQESVQETVLPGEYGTLFLNISIPFTGQLSYYCSLEYYVGKWKPNSYLQDYSYTKYIAGVEFEWNG